MKKILLLILLLSLTSTFTCAQRRGFGGRGHHRTMITRQPHGHCGYTYRGVGRSYRGPVIGRHSGFGWRVASPIVSVTRTVVVENNYQPEEEEYYEPETVYVEKPVVVEEAPQVNIKVNEVRETPVYTAPTTTGIDYSQMWRISFWFNCGSSNSDYYKDKANAINLKNIVIFMNEHPDAGVVLDGYASKHCGSDEINYRLARDRANYIKNCLIKKGIESCRIRVVYCYVPQQYYDEKPEYNQCVVAHAERL